MRHRLLFLLPFMLCLLPGASMARPATVDPQRPVLAMYFPWYEPSDWTHARMADLPAQPYSGGDVAVIAQHVQQAGDHGIDGFICDWYGPAEARLTDRCGKLLAAAGGHTFGVTVMPDQAADFTGTLKTPAGMAAALTYARDHWMSHPNWLRWQGKPVVVFWNPQSFGSVAAWQALRQEVDPDHSWFWFGEGTDFGYLDVFDALYYYDISWAADPASAMAGYATRLNAYNRGHNASKPFIGTVVPGYDDTRIRNGRIRARSDGDYYNRAWAAALDHAPQAVIINSWNEWLEGTQIEPSQSYGARYLDITRDWSGRLKAGAAPPPTNTRTFPETGQTVSGRLLDFWDRSGGLPVFGLPLNAEAETRTADGTYRAQLFERNRLELHPDLAPPYDVLLGRLGVDLLVRQGRPWEAAPREAPRDGCRFFAETGHTLCEPFLSYWQTHGLDMGDPGVSERESLALFGLPITTPAPERNSSGDTVQTQWFERARFEYHPNNPAPYTVLLGRLGAESR